MAGCVSGWPGRRLGSQHLRVRGKVSGSRGCRRDPLPARRDRVDLPPRGARGEMETLPLGSISSVFGQLSIRDR